MMLATIVRPFAAALGACIFLSAGAGTAAPSLGGARVLVNLRLSEPRASYTLIPLALCLLFPARRRRMREIQIAILGVYCLVMLADMAHFYLLASRGRISSTLPVPLSTFLLAVLVGRGMALYLGGEPARLPFWLGLPAVAAAFFLLIAAHIVTFGHTDYRKVETADAAVILGARVYADGRPSPSLEHRLMTGLDLYRQGRVGVLIMSGGTGESGVNEAEAMGRYAVARGVPPERVILDRTGDSTYHSAVHCGILCRRYNLMSVMVVSQYYHRARTKLICLRQGLRVLTVPARGGGQVRSNLYQLLRETGARPYYYLWGSAGGAGGTEKRT